MLAESTVAVYERPPPSTTPAWDAVRDRLRGATEPLLLDARVYALPSPRLPVHAEVAAYARASFPAGRPVAEAALDLCGRIHRDFRYYADVPPLKGVIFADSTGSVMDVAVDMIRVDRG